MKAKRKQTWQYFVLQSCGPEVLQSVKLNFKFGNVVLIQDEEQIFQWMDLNTQDIYTARQQKLPAQLFVVPSGSVIGF
jgi:hypothetical protein